LASNSSPDGAVLWVGYFVWRLIRRPAGFFIRRLAGLFVRRPVRFFAYDFA
jgi:hypothetical protein